MKLPVKSVVEPLLKEGLSEGAIRALHPELNPDSIRGAVQRYKRQNGLGGVRRNAPRVAVYLSPETATTLQQEADRRSVPPHDLAARLLTHILAGGNLASLLGEDKETAS
ncbi:hypothetical protein ACFPOB_20705 [Bosea eneae]|uniref:Ribbon-helix-helix CopG family protein n=1 Tax=Bosea eneae TaxID=151454 RepID=A0ABW0IW82_9HYPH